MSFKYETVRIEYSVPPRTARYTPDFLLPNGVIIETKGRFVSADRKKHELIQAQHPELDIRFVFSNPRAFITKGSKTRLSDWCDKRGFKWAKGSIPKEWINE